MLNILMYLANVHREMYNSGKTANEKLLLKFVEENRGKVCNKKEFSGCFCVPTRSLQSGSDSTCDGSLKRKVFIKGSS